MNNLEASKKLELRTFKFGEEIVNLCKKIKQDNISGPLIKQLVRSGTSIGANYREANNSSSRKDFTNKIFICKKESEETRYWIKMMNGYLPNNDSDHLLDECQQFIMIFQKIVSTIRNGK